MAALPPLPPGRCWGPVGSFLGEAAGRSDRKPGVSPAARRDCLRAGMRRWRLEGRQERVDVNVG